jgi:hypothetical protein
MPVAFGNPWRSLRATEPTKAMGGFGGGQGRHDPTGIRTYQGFWGKNSGRYAM